MRLLSEMKSTIIHNVQALYFIHSCTHKPHSDSIWTAMASWYKSKEILAIIFVTLIGLPEGFGAWLCSVLAKARLIISVG